MDGPSLGIRVASYLLAFAIVVALLALAGVLVFGGHYWAWLLLCSCGALLGESVRLLWQRFRRGVKRRG